MTATVTPARPPGARPLADGAAPGGGAGGGHPSLVSLAPLAVAAAAGVANAAAAYPWLRGYALGGAPAVLVGAAVASVVPAGVIGGALRRPAWASVAASAALLALAVVAGVAHTPGQISAGFQRGPTDLLTETLPLSGSRDLLLGPLLLVWLAGSLSAELLVRTRRTTAALGATVVAYLLAFAATSGAPDHDDRSGPLLLAGLVLVALVRRMSAGTGTVGVVRTGDHGRRRIGRRVRQAGAGAVLAALVVVVLGLVLPVIPHFGKAPAGLTRRPPLHVSSVVDPVDAIAALREDDPGAAPTILFRLTTSASTPGYVPIAVLNDYDGATWSVDATFSPTGGRVPGGSAPSATGGALGGSPRAVSARVTLLRGDGLPFLPVLGRPADVTGLAVDDNVATGMVVPAGPPRLPLTYLLRSVAPSAGLAGLDHSDGLVTSAPEVSGDLGLPAGTSAPLAAGLRYLATLTGQRPAPTLAFLQSAEAALRRVDSTVDPATSTGSSAPTASRGGTSLAEVITAVTQHGRATPEQFATFFVLMARDLGIPARIATGFRPAGAGRPLAAGSYAVTNREAWTWAQVPVAGVGWVDADATPARTAVETAPPATGAAATTTTLVPHQAGAVPGDNAAGGDHALAPPATPTAVHAGGPAWWAWALVALAAALALVAAGPGVAGVRRATRRRARRCADPAMRAAGAWLELLDALEVAGYRAPPSATASELAAATTEVYGPGVGGPVATVGQLAEQAVYAPARPPAGDDAGRAWAALPSVRRELRRHLDRRQQARALLRVGRQPRRPAGRGQPEPGRG